MRKLKKRRTPNDPFKNGSSESAGELTSQELEGVQGGNSISILTKMPNYTGPKLHAPGSIAQGDTIDNEDNLSDAGGGVISLSLRAVAWCGQPWLATYAAAHRRS